MKLRIATAIVSGGMSLLLALTTLLWIFAIGGKGWLGVAPLIDSIRSTLSLVILLTSCTSDALQGFLVSQRHTWGINQAAWVGAVVMLGTAVYNEGKMEL